MLKLPLALLLACSLAACSSPDSRANLGPWVEPSVGLAQQIERQAQRLPWTHGLERVELIQWFAAVGEPAYPTLLNLVLDPRVDVAGAALAALGATQDSRLVEPLQQLPWPDKNHTDLALERSRTLLRLGDWSMVPHLIGGLEDNRLLTRALCGQALYEATSERFGFNPDGSPEERAASVKSWQKWWNSRQADTIREG